MVIIESLVPVVAVTGILAGWVALRPRRGSGPEAPLRQQPGVRLLTDPDELDRALARAVRYDDDAARRMIRHVRRYEQMSGSEPGWGGPGRAVG